MNIWYCFVDRPWHPTTKPNRKPKHEHRTLESAVMEFRRLARRLKSRVLVLQVVHEESPLEAEQARGLPAKPRNELGEFNTEIEICQHKST